MNLNYSETYRDFQREVADFLKAEWTAKAGDLRARGNAFIREFRVAATARGYLYRGFPQRYGGSEQAPDVLKAKIIGDEFAATRAPKEVGGNGPAMLAPTLLECGTEWQKDHFIPKTLTGEYIWAQGYSEPGAGSDLASLKTSAKLEGDEWVINGQKIWTTNAHNCNFMFALCRTEPGAAKHDGISYLLLDLKQKGVTVRPLKQITGGAEFSEVFLDDARTPADWIVGERGKGWVVSRSTLKHERSAVGAATGADDLFDKLVKLAKSTMLNGKPAIQDPLIRDRILRLEGQVKAYFYSGYYQLTKAAHKEPAGIIELMNKLNASTIAQDVAVIANDIIGDRAMLMPETETGKRAGDERWINQILGSLALGIAGGTSNIQRNIIAERGLGLPREP